MLKLGWMWIIPILPSLPGSLWPGAVVSDRVLSMGQIELNSVFVLNWIVWNRHFWHLNSVFKLNWIVWNITVYMYRIKLALNRLQWLICYKTKPRGCPHGVMVKAMDCGIVVREFVLQSCYYVHFRANTLGKSMNPLILPAMG